jgi:hypothetical protein
MVNVYSDNAETPDDWVKYRNILKGDLITQMMLIQMFISLLNDVSSEIVC